MDVQAFLKIVCKSRTDQAVERFAAPHEGHANLRRHGVRFIVGANPAFDAAKGPRSRT